MMYFVIDNCSRERAIFDNLQEAVDCIITLENLSSSPITLYRQKKPETMPTILYKTGAKNYIINDGNEIIANNLKQFANSKIEVSYYCGLIKIKSQVRKNDWCKYGF